MPFVALCFACAGAPAPPEEIPAHTGEPASAASTSVMGTIVATNVSWADLFSQGRADALQGFYTKDAVLMTPQGDLAGAAAIGEHFRVLFAAQTDSILATHTVTETLDVAGDMAYEAGTVTRTVRDRADTLAPSREQRVRYMTFWQRDADGRWRIRRSLRAP